MARRSPKGTSVVARLNKLSDNKLARGASDERERVVALPLAALSAETFSARQRPRFFLPAAEREEGVNLPRLDTPIIVVPGSRVTFFQCTHLGLEMKFLRA
jgi:hypothetical protein